MLTEIFIRGTATCYKTINEIEQKLKELKIRTQRIEAKNRLQHTTILFAITKNMLLTFRTSYYVSKLVQVDVADIIKKYSRNIVEKVEEYLKSTIGISPTQLSPTKPKIFTQLLDLLTDRDAYELLIELLRRVAPEVERDVTIGDEVFDVYIHDNKLNICIVRNRTVEPTAKSIDVTWFLVLDLSKPAESRKIVRKFRRIVDALELSELTIERVRSM